MTTARALIALGSNVEARRNLPEAIRRLAPLGRITHISQVYETEAVGPAGQPHFLNAAVALECELSPGELHQALRRIEAELGRVRPADDYAPRPIDLDLAWWLGGDQATDPDPESLERAYLAQVLAEVAPAARHPQTEKSLAQIAAGLRPAQAWRPQPEVQAAMVAAANQSAPPAAATGLSGDAGTADPAT